ncbi:MAG: succinate--CoA ligase subunit beta [Candidatus Fischerbacteria bacterium RBG_13_37_8]|uniref:Succinate--CoA ligase [ADP-forming] subunit beta n=1 Tax=Candidatus Fischerbacteria bacterium RBG_13_37_8 TaxID=1817863 RepID=A0A1F5VN73_9BACT|nr:MAG: succinate--CoA ligase subunit beta [Candidatus Fischerbacteria bacterium RBG_13_37_8]
MKIHEYQAKRIFKEYGVPIPNGDVVFTSEEAAQIAKKLNVRKYVLKAQVHAGGRGKAGGIKIATTVEEVENLSRDMIGMILKTHQTGAAGRKVRSLLVEEAMDIDKELYLGLTVDRANECLVLLGSPAGGVEIEVVAEKNPELLFKERIDILGLRPYMARRMAFNLGLKDKQISAAVAIMQAMFKIFIQKDASLVEINPLIITKQGNIVALDAKINFDDNALFRQAAVKDMRDLNEEEPLEVEASNYKLNYIKLDGNVGCMVNGAGLAMSTMDIIKLAGGEPANFLDVGGGATKDQVAHAFRILISDKNVKAILINIFGGIMRCDVVAAGIVDAAKEVKVNLPMVVRLQGTNMQEGRQILKESGLTFGIAETMQEAASKVTDAIK